MTRWVSLDLLMAALLLLEVLIGGARLAFAAPAAGLVGLAAVICLLPGWRTTGRPAWGAAAATVAFAVYILFRNRFSEVEYIGRLHFLIVAASLAVYLLFAFVLTRPHDRKIFFGFVIALCTLQLVPAAVQFFSQDGWMPLPFAQRRPGMWPGRVSGFFISPNNYAGFVEVGALLAAAYALLGRMGKWRRVLLLLASLACVAGTLASGSRGGYIGLGAGVFALTVLVLSLWIKNATTKKRAARPAAVLAGLVLALGATWWAISSDPYLSDRVQEISNPQDVRPLLWSSALQQFKLSPLVGTGAFSFLYYGRMLRDPSVQGDPIHVHNDYLQLLADYGLIGGLLFAAVLILHSVSGLRSFGQFRSEVAAVGGQSDRLALLAGCLAVLVAYFAHSVVEFNVQLPLNALVIAAVLACLANAGAPGGAAEPGEVPTGPEVAVRTALALTGIVLAAAAWRVMPGEYFVERARYALREGQTGQALEWSRFGLQGTKDNPELRYHAGEAAMQLSFASPEGALTLREEAVGHFAEGLRLFPYDSRLVLKLAQAQAATGDYPSASESLVYAEQLDPNSGLVPAFRGIVEYWSGDREAARDAFEQALTFGKDGAVIAREGLQGLKEDPAEPVTTDQPQLPRMSEELRKMAEEEAGEEDEETGD